MAQTLKDTSEARLSGGRPGVWSDACYLAIADIMAQTPKDTSEARFSGGRPGV